MCRHSSSWRVTADPKQYCNYTSSIMLPNLIGVGQKVMEIHALAWAKCCSIQQLVLVLICSDCGQKKFPILSIRHWFQLFNWKKTRAHHFSCCQADTVMMLCIGNRIITKNVLIRRDCHKSTGGYKVSMMSCHTECRVQRSETRVDTPQKKPGGFFWVNPPKKPGKKPGKNNHPKFNPVSFLVLLIT